MQRLIRNTLTLFALYDVRDVFFLLGSYMRILVRNRMTGTGSVEQLVGFTVVFPSRATFFSQFSEIFLERVYVLRKQPHMVIMDCGSNIGMSVLYFKWQCPDATITCFEPNQEALRYLQENVERNHLSSVTVFPYAVGKTERIARFHHETKATASTGATLLDGRDVQDAYTEVAVRPLSVFISGPVDLLKIDVEGAEAEVLEDLVQTGKIAFINALCLEYHFDIVPVAYPLNRVRRMLEEAGLVIHRVETAANAKTALVYASREGHTAV